MCAVKGYTVNQRRRHAHRGEDSGDTVGNRIFPRGRHIVRSGFGGGAAGREVSRSGHLERDASCGEFLGNTS